MLQSAERCTKTGERVMEVLHTKYLETCPPTATSMDSYPELSPEIVPVDINNNTVTAVAGRLSGGSEPGVTGSFSLQHWLLCFRVAIG